MVDNETSNVLESLRDFLSTPMRRNLFLHFVFSKRAPSDLSKSSGVPLSTVDMVTNTLKLMEVLKEAKGKDSNKNWYQVDLERWIEANLVEMGFGFINDDDKKTVMKIMGDQKFLAMSYLLTDPTFARLLYWSPVKMGYDLIVFDLVELLKSENMISDLPAYILLCIVFFPSFKQLKENLFSTKDLPWMIELMNEGAAQRPFLSKALGKVDKAYITLYSKQRATLFGVMEKLIEKRLQSLSRKAIEKEVERKAEAEKKPAKPAKEEEKEAEAPAEGPAEGKPTEKGPEAEEKPKAEKKEEPKGKKAPKKEGAEEKKPAKKKK